LLLGKLYRIGNTGPREGMTEAVAVAFEISYVIGRIFFVTAVVQYAQALGLRQQPD